MFTLISMLLNNFMFLHNFNYITLFRSRFIYVTNLQMIY